MTVYKVFRSHSLNISAALPVLFFFLLFLKFYLKQWEEIPTVCIWLVVWKYSCPGYAIPVTKISEFCYSCHNGRCAVFSSNFVKFQGRKFFDLVFVLI